MSYLIESEGKGAVIDTSRMADVYEQFAKERSIEITHLLDTYLHANHISDGRELAEKLGGTYYLPPKDAEELVFDYIPSMMVVGLKSEIQLFRLFIRPDIRLGAPPSSSMASTC